MPKRTLIVLWILTLVVAAGLTAATAALAARSRSYRILNDTVFLTSGEVSVHLHERADPDSPIVAGLVRGSAVTVLDLAKVDGRIWYLVQKGTMVPGWIPAEEIRLSPP